MQIVKIVLYLKKPNTQLQKTAVLLCEYLGLKKKKKVKIFINTRVTD